jgi:hypothetical protein
MPFEEGYEMFQYALNAEIEDKMFIRWINGYQQVMGFNEFKNQIGADSRQVRDNRTADEILESVRGIIG